MKKVLLRTMLPLFAFCFSCAPDLASCTERKMKGHGEMMEGHGQTVEGHGYGGGYHHGQMMEDYDPKESFERFSEKLNLSKEQKEKVRPILNKEVIEIKKVYADAWEKEKRIIETSRQKVMGVLNPQQKEVYKKMIEERKLEKE